MIDINALFKISYGLYIVCSGDDKSGNGFISNTIFQVTAEPPKFAACCNKNNYTSDFIEKYGNFTVSILHQQTQSDLYGRFGYKSGKNINKLEGLNIKYGETGAPIVLDDCIAYLECKVVDKFDVGTHWLFIGELINCETINDTLEPITYSYYRQIKKGVAPKNAPTYISKEKLKMKTEVADAKKYRCDVCSHIYDEAIENTKFADLPDDWSCPDCGAGKDEFKVI